MLQSPVNIVSAGQPGQTALKVAALRAVHQLLDDPIVLHDPVALPILGSKYAAELTDDHYQLNDPPSRALRAALVVRARFAEDELARRRQACANMLCLAQGSIPSHTATHMRIKVYACLRLITLLHNTSSLRQLN